MTTCQERLASYLKKTLQRTVSGTCCNLLEEDVTTYQEHLASYLKKSLQRTYQERLASYLQKMLQRMRKIWQVS